MRQLISLFLILLFSAFIATPTFVVLSGSSTDISYLHSSSEEEKTHNERFFEESENKKLNNFYTFESALLDSYQKFILGVSYSLWNPIYFDIQVPPPDLS
tara:strand:+ start:1498 stop:1797 length:300 start_codon:yes stop_codon:yes gene_type:complete